MKRYQSHKVVEAAPIVAAEFAADGSGTVVVKGTDEDGGNPCYTVPAGFKRPNTEPAMDVDGGDYLVRYEGGYLSWSPKAVFEAGYTELAPATPGTTDPTQQLGSNSYRKKPVVIEAFQMTKERRASNADWPSWMHEAWNQGAGEPGSLFPADYPHSNGTDELKIGTLEGTLLVSWGDYIIRGVQGELYPCKPDIFEATYSPG